MNYLLVGLGGLLGANARYILGGLLARSLKTTFPYETLVINVVGSFVLGFFMVVATDRFELPPEHRLLFAIGFLGSFTTFSTFTYETLVLLEEGDLLLGLANIVASVALGVLAGYLGILLGRLF